MDKTSPLMRIICARRSIRKFRDKPVPRRLLLSCVKAARFAPSACNVQPWRFLLVDDPGLKEELARKAFSGVYLPMRWAAKAPALAVLLAGLDIKANRVGALVQGTDYYLLDMGIAGEHFVLRAQELGFGTCWIGWFSAAGVRQVLQVPRKYRVVGLIAVGYPLRLKPAKKRQRALNDIAFFNKLP